MSFTPIVLAAVLAGSAPDAGATAPAAPEKLEVQADEHGGIVVSARGKAPPEDPLQAFNLETYAIVQKLDDLVIAPVAHGYEKTVPAPLRHGLHNVLIELEEPTAFVNFLLMHKIGKAAETLARFTINATIGLGGLIDIAGRKAINLPHRPNGFANTMGFYGIGSGPYLFLPLFGSTSVRDFAGRLLDLGLLPATVGKPFKGPYWTFGHGAASSIDDRVEMDILLNQIRTESADPYGTKKKYYLDKRKADIAALHGIILPPPQVLPALPVVPVGK